MALTDVAIRNAKPGAKAIKLADGDGMFLLITPAGGKLWRLKYRIDGREKLLAIGSYPEIGLGEARRRREEARELVARGKDPSREKQREKIRAKSQAADTFKAICDEYCEKRRRDGQKGWSPATATRSEYLLKLVCGSIGKLPIGEIEPADVLAASRDVVAAPVPQQLALAAPRLAEHNQRTSCKARIVQSIPSRNAYMLVVVRERQDSKREGISHRRPLASPGQSLASKASEA